MLLLFVVLVVVGEWLRLFVDGVVAGCSECCCCCPGGCVWLLLLSPVLLAWVFFSAFCCRSGWWL